MERVPFTVAKNALIPIGVEADAVMAKLTIGEQVAVEVYRPRDNRFSAKVQFVFERIAQARGMRVRNIRGWIAAMTGRADAVVINNETALVAWGTGPRDMGEADFQAFWDDAREVISEKILPTLDANDANSIALMMEDTRTGGV